jgi:hypothetical protein
MAEADWTVLDDSLSSGAVARGVTAGFTPPNGGGSFVFGYNSLSTAVGAVGFFTNLTNFAPMAKGGRITGAIKRAASGGPTGFSAFLFIGLQGTSVDDEGYLLGLSDDDPSRIVLRKGAISAGLPDDAPAAGNGILRRSTDAFDIDDDDWVHLRLDMIFNDVGDVRLQVFQNDLAAHALGTAPTWTAIAGMTEFVDDALGVNSGSAPFTSGRVGHAFRTSDVTRRAQFDHIEVRRQT